MKRFGLLFVLFSITSAAFAQVSTGTVTALPPIAFGFSNSVVDQSGNVLIFDESFVGPMGATTPTSLTSQTHVIVVSSDGKTISGNNYGGSFQILGVGQNAVYALVNTFTWGTGTGTGTTVMPVFSRQVVALHVVAGALPATLPSIDVTSTQEVRLGLALGANMPDTIALVSGNRFILPPILAAGGTPSPVAGTPHTVWLYTCDGLTFTPNANNPISTAGH